MISEKVEELGRTYIHTYIHTYLHTHTHTHTHIYIYIYIWEILKIQSHRRQQPPKYPLALHLIMVCLIGTTLATSVEMFSRGHVELQYLFKSAVNYTLVCMVCVPHVNSNCDHFKFIIKIMFWTHNFQVLCVVCALHSVQQFFFFNYPT